MLEKWHRLGSRFVGDFRIFSMVSEDFSMPDGRTHSFFVLLSKDWVNVVPVTKEGKIVLIRQFRAGSEEVTIEVPGGMVDNETPEQAALRELEEETGYEALQLIKTGVVRPNPAFIRNRCHMFLALGATPTGKTHFDPSEFVETFEATFEEVEQMILDGRIDHSLVINTIFFAKKLRGVVW